MVYSDIHRQFLQVVMSRGCISRDSANKVLAEIFASRKYSIHINNSQVLLHFYTTLLHVEENGTPPEDVQMIIDAINEKIHAFDQRIDIVSSMYDDKEYVVMVNTTQSAIMK